jgi:hypothetical protein
MVILGGGGRVPYPHSEQTLTSHPAPSLRWLRPCYMYRGTCLIRKCRPLGPYLMPMFGTLRWFYGSGRLRGIPVHVCENPAGPHLEGAPGRYRRAAPFITGVPRSQETITPLGPPQVPRHRAAVGSYGGGVLMSEVSLYPTPIMTVTPGKPPVEASVYI